MGGSVVIGVNEVSLHGRVTSLPTERTLPSGLDVVSFRISVARGPTPLAKGSSARSDWVECVTADRRAARTARACVTGDTVELRGVLRRRFFRGDAGGGSRLEVEVLRARRVSHG